MKKIFRLVLLLLTVQVFPACNLSYTEDDNSININSDTAITQDSTKTDNPNNILYVTGGETLSIVPGTISNIVVINADAVTTKPVEIKALPKPPVKIALHSVKKTVSKPVKSDKIASKAEIKNQYPISLPIEKNSIITCGAPATVANNFQKSDKDIVIIIASYFSTSNKNINVKCRHSIALSEGFSQYIDINILFARPPTV